MAMRPICERGGEFEVSEYVRLFHPFLPTLPPFLTTLPTSRTVEHLGVLGQARADGRKQTSGRLVLLAGFQQQLVLDAVLGVGGKHTDGAKVEVGNGDGRAGGRDGGDGARGGIRVDDHPLSVGERGRVRCVSIKAGGRVENTIIHSFFNFECERCS